MLTIAVAFVSFMFGTAFGTIVSLVLWEDKDA